MKIRTRFILALSCFVFLFTVISALVLRELFALRSENLEGVLVAEVLTRGMQSLEAETETLRRMTGDWGGWDDTYDFIATRSEEFIESNLVDETFKGLRINVILFLDLAGRVVYGKAMSLDPLEKTEIPKHLLLHFSASDHLWRHASPSNHVAGVLVAGGNIWQIASEPIITSENEGPVRGAVVFARIVQPHNSLLLPRSPSESFTLAALSGQHTWVEPRIRATSATRMYGETLIADVYGRPSVNLTVEVPRRIRLHDTVSLLLLTASVLLCGTAVGLAAVFGVDRWVLRRLDSSVSALREGLSAVPADGQLHVSDDLGRSDEIGELARSVNAMLTTLSARQKQLIRSQRLAALGTLVAGMAHEVNNPNSVIELNAGVMARRLADRSADAGSLDGLLDMLAEIRDASARIAAIVKALRDFARPADEGMSAGVSINEVVRDACNLTRHHVARRGTEISTTLPADLPSVRGNAQQLTQVAVNLIQNACDASDGSNKAVEVETSFDAGRGEIVLTVADQGKGISDADREHIFDPFFTTRREKGEGGMGLGLAIATSTVESHGGRIQVDSTLGEGTRMSVFLPAAGG